MKEQDPSERFTDWTSENLQFFDKEGKPIKSDKTKKEEKKPPRKK